MTQSVHTDRKTLFQYPGFAVLTNWSA